MSDRIVVTGIGLWTALGQGREQNLARLVAGETGLSASRLLDVEGLSGRTMAEVALPDPTPPERGATRCDRLAAATIAEALAQAGLDPEATPVELIASVSAGGMYETERLLTQIWRGGEITEESVRALAVHPISAAVDHADRVVGPFSRAATVCSACSGGALALGLGATRLHLGRCDAVVAGGVDSLSRLTVAGFGSLQSLDPEACRPFARSRRGLVLGEGAAFLVLEREQTARDRGATVLGYLGGWAVRSEAHHITHPEPAGETAAQVIRLALADAGVRPDEIGYVSAHGTGTPLNDAMESRALALSFGEHAARVPVSSQKAQIGHTLAAAGAIEAAATLLALGAQMLLPNVTGGEVEPGLGLSVAGQRGVASDADIAVSNSFGFGGSDASLVLSRAPLPRTPRAARTRDELVITAARTLGIGGIGLPPAAGQRLLRAGETAAVLPETPAADLRALLDPDRARRLDGLSRAHTVILEALLQGVSREQRSDTGLVASSAFGSTDLAATFFARIEDKGARFASPADFPNLVPSSAGANAAIYSGLRGPSLAVAELSVGIFAALETASDLLWDRRASAMVALQIETVSVMVEKVLARAAGTTRPGPRTEGGAAFLLERRHDADEAGRAPLATLLASGVARGARQAIPTPGGSGVVVLVEEDAELIQIARAAGWGDAQIVSAGVRFGGHEAVSAMALAGALALLSRGTTDRALVLDRVGRRLGFAVLGAP